MINNGDPPVLPGAKANLQSQIFTRILKGRGNERSGFSALASPPVLVRQPSFSTG